VSLKTEAREEGMKQVRQDIDSILEKYPRHPKHLISLLQDVQAEFSYISPEHLTLICDHAGVPLTQAWSVVTFYYSERLID
jgi:NADH:ubiquinone oxidoreductase subunit E